MLRRLQRGISLVEIVVALSILMILASLVGLAMSRQRANRQLDAAAAELATALRYTRQLAKSQGGATVTFSLAAGTQNSYSIADAAGVVHRSGQLPPTVVLTVPSALNPMQFNANGSVTSAGSITVASAATGRTKSITVQASTGGITM